MAKFRKGAPQIGFVKRDGSVFVNTFHSAGRAAKAVRAYKSKGGKVTGARAYGYPKSATRNVVAFLARKKGTY